MMWLLIGVPLFCLIIIGLLAYAAPVREDFE